MSLLFRLGGRLGAQDGPTPDLDQSLSRQASQAPAARPELSDMVHAAWAAGQGIDLDGVGYGPTHWMGECFHAAPMPYYFFLAGLVRSQGCRAICEVGTHYGGSCFSMLRGAEGQAQILTVDVADINSRIAHTAGITKLTGDANSSAIIKAAALHFAGQPIDLLYIDSDHKFVPTLSSLGIYCTLLRPRLVVLDDVMLNPQMRSLWDVLTMVYGANAVNCTDVVADIRGAQVGFGLLKMR